LKKIKFFFHIYYALLLTVGLYGVSNLKSLLSSIKQLPIEWTYSRSLTIDIFSLVTLVILLFTLIKPSKILRFSSGVLINVLFALVFYLEGSTYHSCHPWLISSLFLPFFKEKEGDSNYNKKLVRVLQTILLSNYFFSGFQKIFMPLKEFEKLKNVALDHFFTRLQSSRGSSLALTSEIFNNFPNFIFIVFLLIIIFQLSSLLAIFNYKYRKWFVYGIVFFHIAVLVFMGIPFTLTPVALVLFLIYIDPFLFDRVDQDYAKNGLVISE